jgi:RNA recognition motif-containing protein
MAKPGCNLMVNNFPRYLDSAALRTLFEPFGAVEITRVVRKLANGRSRGFGFVEFSTTEAGTQVGCERVEAPLCMCVCIYI